MITLDKDSASMNIFYLDNPKKITFRKLGMKMRGIKQT